MVKDGFLNGHIPTIRKLQQPCQAMLGALSRHMPEGVRWNSPKGGMFLWAELPKGMDAGALLAKAVENNVAFVPGACVLLPPTRRSGAGCAWRSSPFRRRA